MSTFTSELIVSPLDSGKHWRLEEEFSYHVGEYPSDDIVTVPKGHITDFASIPRLFWRILPPWGKYGKASVIHDYLCDTRMRSSKETHRIFYEAMGVLGVKRWKKEVMYRAVKWFGPKF